MPDQHRAPLQHALDLLTQHANPALHDQLNTWLTCGGCIVTALQAAQPAGGRAVVSTIFALQARLQGNSKPPAIPEQALAPIAPERFGDQFMVLVREDLYDPHTGLHWEDAGFLAAESLCW